MELRIYGDTESRSADLRIYGVTETRTCGIKDLRINRLTNLRTFMEYKKKTYSGKPRKNGSTNFDKYGKESVDPEIRRFVNPIKPLMTEEEKSNAQILELSYDFSCRIIRLYKYLNEGKLSKADRDIIDALGRQLLRSATSINANINEAQHPQSDADFLSKATIALKESRESNNWIKLLGDNGFLEPRMCESLLHDGERILRILITITAKVRKRIQGSKD